MATDLRSVDAAIVGGGFFGGRIALQLAGMGYSACLLEQSEAMMTRASYVNQARVHGGYHYPRSVLTALRSRVNLPVFTAEYGDCVDTSFDSYYAIARRFSKVSARQFKQFCDRIGAPTSSAAERVTGLFDPGMVEAVFRVEEYAFDAVHLESRLRKQLDDAGVTILLGAEVVKIGAGRGAMMNVVYRRDGRETSLQAGRVFNATYSRLNQLNRASGFPVLALKHEIAEIALFEPPEQLAGLGITVMCGPFFSAMPFPAAGLHSLTHVRYTPHTEWIEDGMTETRDPYEYLRSVALTSAYPRMLADAKRYLPSMSASRYVTSRYEIKTVLPQSEVDDSRPILIKQDHGIPGLTCVMGGKLDNVYDVLKELR